jgi:hypothetical protein
MRAESRRYDALSANFEDAGLLHVRLAARIMADQGAISVYSADGVVSVWSQGRRAMQ